MACEHKTTRTVAIRWYRPGESKGHFQNPQLIQLEEAYVDALITCDDCHQIAWKKKGIRGSWRKPNDEEKWYVAWADGGYEVSLSTSWDMGY